MVINDLRNNCEVIIGELKPGDTFVYNSELYMVLERDSMDSDKYGIDCVNLNRNTVESFCVVVTVNKCHADINIR